MLSGNRNFEGRINPDVKMNYLASPPLVVAYALAGSMDVDLVTDPLGTDSDGNDVLPRRHLAVAEGGAGGRRCLVRASGFSSSYADVFAGDDRWQSLEVPSGDSFAWADASTYVRRPPYFDGMDREPTGIEDIHGAGCWRCSATP